MWVIISEERMTEDKERYTAYGVRSGCYCIGDLCTDSDEILRFVRVLNNYEVSAAEDFLAAGGFPEELIADLGVSA